MITNGTATRENYYRVNFLNYGETFAYGVDATSAILNARADLMDDNRETQFGGASARPAVYGEWDCGTHHFHNDGSHSHDYGLER